MLEPAMLPPTARRCDVRQSLAIHSTRDRRELAVAMHNAAAPPWRVTHPAVGHPGGSARGTLPSFFLGRQS